MPSARAHAPYEGQEHVACEHGVVVHHQHFWKPGAGPNVRMITAASIAVAVELLGMACALPDSGSKRLWIMSNPAAHADRRAPPWCAGTSDTSARTTPTSGPIQKARRRIRDPVLARPKCPPNGASWH